MLLSICCLGLFVSSCGSDPGQGAVPANPTPDPATTADSAENDPETQAPSDNSTSDDGTADNGASDAEEALLGERNPRPPATATSVPTETGTPAATPSPTSLPTPTASPTKVPTATPTPRPSDPVTALITANGIVVPVLSGGPDGWWVFSPCAEITLITGAGATEITGTTVMIDPGHGGDETGAVGPTGIIEGDVNLDVATRVLAWLDERGIDAMSTRYSDYRVAIHARGELARMVQPKLFVSIHHNAGFPEPIDEPGTEIYYQFDNPESRRLGGLLYEEVFETASAVEGVQWLGNDHRGTQWRLNPDGTDLYGVLRRPAAAGVVAALTEATFLNSEDEEQLLTDPDFLQAEAEAIGRAIERWLTTNDDPDDETARHNEGIIFEGTLGPGGGTEGCVDPELE